MDSLASVSGLASGLNWRNIIDQLIEIDRASVKVFQNQRDKYDSQLKEWKSIHSQLLGLKTIAEKLRKASTYNIYQSSLASSSSTDAESILTVTNTNTAARGSYDIRVLQKAQSQKLGSAYYGSKTTALSLSGEFIVAGQGVEVSSTDTLEDVRDKINNLNTGSNATGVTATIISKSTTSYQLVLTSDDAGSDGYSLLDASTTDILQSLGFASSTETLRNQTSDGAKSDAFTSSATAIASLRGLNSAPGSTSVTIAGQAVSIDLTTESLSDIATNINALTGVTASVVSETDTDGNTTYQLDISGTTSFSDSSNVLEILGILEGTRATINEEHVGATANSKTTGAGGGAIADGTLWSEINTGSDANNITLNDTITISGTDHDGTAVSATFTIANLSQALNASGGFLETIENTFGNSSTVNAYISDGTDGHTAGQLVVKDLQAGDSLMDVDIFTNNEGGGTLDFGTFSESVTGRSMELTAGQDARVEIDGVVYSRSSNSITDLISGTKLDLVSADSSTTITLSIDRDVSAIKEEVNSFIESYNAIIGTIHEQMTYDTENQKPGGILFGDGTLRSVQTDLLSEVIQTISGLSSSYTSLGLIGLNLNDDGTLEVDDTELTDLLHSNYSDVVDLLSIQGSGSISTIQFVGIGRDTVAGTYAVNITQAASKATTSGSVDLSGGIAGAETVTVTDSFTSRIATISLSAGDDIDEIVSKFNTEFQTEYTQALTGATTYSKTSAAGGGTITSATAWGDINTGGDANDVTNGDTITFTGTSRSGSSVSGSYTISDKSTDTVQGLLSAIESAFDNGVYATINTNGAIVVTDRKAGTSQLAFSLTENNQGGGSLDFGAISTTTTGRYAVEITASKDASSKLVLTHDSYGSSFGFTISQTANNLGITDATYTGNDVTGTINGESATGNGRLLSGDDGETNIDGLVIEYTGTTLGSVGNITVSLGFFEELERAVFAMTDNFEGYVKFKMDSLGDNIKRMDKRIEQRDANLELKRARLVSRFLVMEDTIAKLNAQSAWPSSQTGIASS